MKINRYAKNPIITIPDVKPSNPMMNVIGVFNCGAVMHNGETLLLLRVAENVVSNEDEVIVPIFNDKSKKLDYKKFSKQNKNADFSDVRFVKLDSELYLTSISHLRFARSLDGINFTIDEKPFIEPSEYYEEYGVEDPRIVYIEDRYYITYSAISSSGVMTCIAETFDFVDVKKKGIIFLCDNKDIALFPEKINGSYYAINRPFSAYFKRPEMWISKSNDLLAYYDHQRLALPRKDYFDSARIGVSLTPIKTEHGWLVIYHGATIDNVYTVGALLLDLNDPSIILKRSSKPSIYPQESYELEGFMPKVIFPCGYILDGDKFSLYYGNCDENICLLDFSLNELLNELLNEV